MARQNPKVRRVLNALTKAAHVASVIVDGEEAGRILTGDSARYIANPDPEHRYLALDHFVVEHGPFLRMKKTLKRLAMLVDPPCSACLWITLDGLQDKVTPLVQDGAMGRYYNFGAQTADITPEMAACLEKGEVVVAPEDHPRNTLTVLAPVFDSLGDTVGFVELSAAHPITNKIVPGYN